MPPAERGPTLSELPSRSPRWNSVIPPFYFWLVIGPFERGAPAASDPMTSSCQTRSRRRASSRPRRGRGCLRSGCHEHPVNQSFFRLGFFGGVSSTPELHDGGSLAGNDSAMA